MEFLNIKSVEFDFYTNKNVSCAKSSFIFCFRKMQNQLLQKEMPMKCEVKLTQHIGKP